MSEDTNPFERGQKHTPGQTCNFHYSRSVNPWYLSFSALVTVALLAACSSSTKPNAQDLLSQSRTPVMGALVGSYAFSSGSEPQDVQLAVNVSSSGSNYSLDFQGWHADARGAAPDGFGIGRLDAAGVFHFSYKDSFSNVGSGTFRRTQTGYQLSIDIDKVSDSRCMMFYGDFTLQRAKSIGQGTRW